jgi:hypothetical protein
MSSIERSIDRAEEKLGLNRGLLVTQIIDFSGLPLPPERRDGNIITRYIVYESIQKQREGGAGHEH